eukprot:6178560-Pleurochrysis_carterae.AAC.3
MNVEQIDPAKLRKAASTVRLAIDEELVTDALQNRQQNESPPLDAWLVGHKLEQRWRYHLIPTLSAPSPASLNTYMWCEAEVERVAAGTSDTR